MKTTANDRLLFGFPVSVSFRDAEEKMQFAEEYIRAHRLDLKCRRQNGNVVVYPQICRYADIELTNVCNARCVFCPREKMQSIGHMEENIFYKVIDKIRNANIGKIMFIGRGEALLHPRALEYIRSIRDYTGVKLEIFTNGTPLTPEVTDALAELNDGILQLRINVSLHSLRRDMHEKMVGVDLRTVVRNLRYLMSKKEKLSYSVCFVKNKLNEAETQKLQDYFARHGIKKTGIDLVYNKGGHVDNRDVFDRDFYLRSFVPAAGKIPEAVLCEYTFGHLAYSINYRGEFTICHDDFEDMYKLGHVLEDDFIAIDAKIDALKKTGGTEQCKGCTKYLREAYHGGNKDAEAMPENKIVL